MIARAHEWLLRLLFNLAALLVASAIPLILYDVLARNLGCYPFAHTLAVTEYGLFYMTLLGAPGLARRRQHIYIQFLTGLAGPRLRPWLGRLALVIAALVCATLAGYGAVVTHDLYLRADIEVRSFDMPRWLVFAAVPLSFALLAVEFLRLLRVTDAMYDERVGIRE